LVKITRISFFKSVFLKNEITGYDTINHIYILTLSSSINRRQKKRNQHANKRISRVFPLFRLVLDLFVKHVLLRNGRVRMGHTPEELGILPTPEVREKLKTIFYYVYAK